ncbi:hypothetical protein ACJJTC_018974 [Scirpophaga incertulas]
MHTTKGSSEYILLTFHCDQIGMPAASLFFIINADSRILLDSVSSLAIDSGAHSFVCVKLISLDAGRATRTEFPQKLPLPQIVNPQLYPDGFQFVEANTPSFLCDSDMAEQRVDCKIQPQAKILKSIVHAHRTRAEARLPRVRSNVSLACSVHMPTGRRYQRPS